VAAKFWNYFTLIVIKMSYLLVAVSWGVFVVLSLFFVHQRTAVSGKSFAALTSLGNEVIVESRKSDFDNGIGLSPPMRSYVLTTPRKFGYHGTGWL